MKPQDLAGWLQEERTKVDELICLVRRHLAVPPPTGREKWRFEARECFRRLAEHLKKHMALEEADGYLREVRMRRPALAHEIDRLQHEHDELGRLMDQVQVALDELKPEDNLLIRSCCVRLATLLSYVEQHEEEEQRLVLHLYSQDIGGSS
jgi:iron-sulfur cluster repair protein YtfE (RIC family)